MASATKGGCSTQRRCKKSRTERCHVLGAVGTWIKPRQIVPLPLPGGPRTKIMVGGIFAAGGRDEIDWLCNTGSGLDEEAELDMLGRVPR
jgi:hypothetical protein